MRTSLFHLLVAAVLFIAVPTTLALVEDVPLRVFLLTLIAILFYGVYQIDKGRAVRKRQSEIEANIHHAVELLPRFEDGRYRLEIRGASMLSSVILSGAFAIFAFVIWKTGGVGWYLVAAAVFLLVFIFFLGREWKAATRGPLFSISRQGLFHKGEFIPWREVEAISLTEMRARASYLCHQIQFTIPSLGRFSSTIPRSVRFFSGLRNSQPSSLIFTIKPNVTHPETVLHLCKMLKLQDSNSDPHMNQIQK